MKPIDYALEYRKKFGWELPSRTLARIMSADLPEIFCNIEQARAYLRSLEGKSNSIKKMRKEIREQVPASALKARPLNPYALPKSYEKAQALYRWPKESNEVLLISDLHVPYHSIGAITAALDYAKTNGINGILILGDFLDNHNVSRFEKDPSKRSVIQELNAGRLFLEQLRANFQDAHIAWAYGNHDVRYEHYLRRQAPELFEDPYYHLHQRLGLDNLNIEWINDLHNPSHHNEVSMSGRMVGAWSLGCLCQLRPDYSPMTGNAQHGFAHVTIEDGGDFLFRNFKVIEKKKGIHQVYPC